MIFDQQCVLAGICSDLRFFRPHQGRAILPTISTSIVNFLDLLCTCTCILALVSLAWEVENNSDVRCGNALGVPLIQTQHHPNRIHISPPLSTAASTIDIIPGLHCPSQYAILLSPSDKLLTRAYNRF
jgi:hypothetical protein